MAILTTEAPPSTPDDDESIRSRTSIPVRLGTVGERRDVRTVPFGDRFDLIGSAAAGIALSSLMFGWLTPMTGVVGWIVLSFIGFLGIYAVMTAMRADRLAISERIMTAL